MAGSAGGTEDQPGDVLQCTGDSVTGCRQGCSAGTPVRSASGFHRLAVHLRSVPARQCAYFNVPGFCDPQVGSQAAQALRLEQCDPAAAAGCWAAVDRELVDEALRVWLYNPHTLTVLAARVGSYQFHPYWGLLTGLLWVRGESR
jgi:hypothetical protein